MFVANQFKTIKIKKNNNFLMLINEISFCKVHIRKRVTDNCVCLCNGERE